MADEDIRSTILKRDEKGQVRNGAEWLALWSDPDSMRSRAEMREKQSTERHQLELAGQLSAAARSLAGRDDIDVQIGEADPAGGLRAGLDELRPDNMPALRGRIDSAALFLRYHDADIHAAVTPERPGDARLFNLLELLRCEAAGAARLKGIGDNLAAALTERELTYFTDTEGGSSGAPVCDDAWRVVALHRGSRFVAHAVNFQGKDTAWINAGTPILPILAHLREDAALWKVIDARLVA